MGTGRLSEKAQIGSYQFGLVKDWRGIADEKGGIMSVEEVEHVLARLGMTNLKPSSKCTDTDWQAWLKALPEMELKIICPRCGDGQLERRQGRHGEFWGCSEFSLSGCRHTESIEVARNGTN